MGTKMDPLTTRQAPARAVKAGNSSRENPGEVEVSPGNMPGALQASWLPWLAALKAILPLYIAIQLAFAVTTVLALLFTVKDFAPQSLPLQTLWQSWYRWDTGNYMTIAINGY